MVKFFLELGADPWQDNEGGKSAMEIACAGNHISLVRCFLSLPFSRAQLSTALITACSLGVPACSNCFSIGNLESETLVVTMRHSALNCDVSAINSKNRTFRKL